MAASAQRLVSQFGPFLPRVVRVINQSVRRVHPGEVVLAQDELVRLCELQTYSIAWPRAGRPVASGQKV